MSVLEDVLKEEYERSLRITEAIEKENLSLPKGSMQVKHIKGKEYHYLVFREGSHVKTRYVPDSDVTSVNEMIIKRKENIKSLKEQKQSRAMIEKALGKKAFNEFAAK